MTNNSLPPIYSKVGAIETQQAQPHTAQPHSHNQILQPEKPDMLPLKIHLVKGLKKFIIIWTIYSIIE